MKWLKLHWLLLKQALVKALGGSVVVRIPVPEFRSSRRKMTHKDWDALADLFTKVPALALWLSKKLARFEKLEDGLSVDATDDRLRLTLQARMAVYREILALPEDAILEAAKAQPREKNEIEVGNYGPIERINHG